MYNECLVAHSMDPLSEVEWEKRDVQIRNGEGIVVYEQLDVEVPKSWSDIAARVAVHKFFFGNLGESIRETSIRQLIHRIANQISDWGFEQGYCLTEQQRNCLYADLCHILVNQWAAFNSPVWFNVGTTEEPQCSACFISELDDTLESIEDLFKTEFEIFRRGSGNGVNLSRVRGSDEKLSKGGNASGPIPFMRALDAACGAMRSGGRARRGALMRILNLDHPDILEYIGLKEHAERMAHTLIDAGFDADWDNGIYKDLPWQNANNSVRGTDSFMEAVEEDREWHLISRVAKKPAVTLRARDLMNRLGEAAWTNGCPGIQFHDTINKWHTCKEDGEIVASNPCSEYMFLDDTSCNLASINLVKMCGDDDTFIIDRFENVIRVMILAQDIVVDVAHYPNEKIATETKKYRTLGLGYANLGAYLMRNGFPYDSKEGRRRAAVITAFMQAVAFDQSADIAEKMGAFDRYAANAQHVREVIRLHKEACGTGAINGTAYGTFDNVLREKALDLFSSTIDRPVRNAQVSVLAPTGTIGLLMDCDSTGVEPSLALVSYKQIHGTGGNVETIVNQSVEASLSHMGFSPSEIRGMLPTIRVDGHVGNLTNLSEDQKAVFDTSLGERSIRWQGHVEMMAAVQPFLSGAISKTINMPNNSTIQDVIGAYQLAWKLGLKAIAIYRDGSKGSQPVNTKLIEKKIRQKLPPECNGKRVKFMIGGVDVYVHTGEYDDGTVGEIFITCAKQGSTLQGLLNSAAVGVSLGLQHGVPLSQYVGVLRQHKFEPSGPVKFPGDERSHFFTSIPDAVAYWLGKTYLKQTNSDGIEERASSDLPLCIDCGTMMVPSGSCFKCPQCGTTSGCS